MKVFLLSFLILFLTSCGFQPMYASKDLGGGNISTKLSNVAISNIPDREGQFLRNELYDRFYKNGIPANPKYSLAVNKPREVERDLDVTVGAESTRSQLRVSTNFRLTNTETGKVLLSERVQSIASFNIIADEYATRISEKNTRENALRDIARQIEQKVVLVLNQEN